VWCSVALPEASWAACSRPAIACRVPGNCRRKDTRRGSRSRDSWALGRPVGSSSPTPAHRGLVAWVALVSEEAPLALLAGASKRVRLRASVGVDGVVVAAAYWVVESAAGTDNLLLMWSVVAVVVEVQLVVAVDKLMFLEEEIAV